MSNETDSGLYTLATQGGITLAGNVAGQALGFAFVAFVTRLVTPAEYGIFTLGLTIVLFVQGFASLSIYRSVDFFLPQFLDNSEYGKAKKTLLNILLIGVTTSVASAFLVFAIRGLLASIFNKPKLVVFLPFLVLLIPLQTVFRILLSSFNGIQKMKYRVLTKNILNPLVRTVAAVLLVSLGGGVFGLIGGYLLGIAFAVVFGTGFLLYEIDWVWNVKSASIANGTLLSYSLPLVLSGVIYSLVGQIDFFLIGYFLSSADVGHYRVGYLLAGNLLIVLNAITPVFKPIITANLSNNSVIRDRYQVATRWITILTLPIALTMVLAPETYLTLFFTEQYAAASLALVALTVGYLFNAAFGPEGMVLEGLGLTKLTLFNTVILVSVNGVLDIILIPRLGILGAGIATGTALTLAGAAGVVEIYLQRSITAFSHKLGRVWLAAAFPCVAGWIVASSGLGLIQTAGLLPLIVVCTYLIGLHITQGFSSEDREIALQIDSHLGYPVVSHLISPTRLFNSLF